ncbi:MAG: hypothetical protein FH748_05725 [Balneolaceae bacterium]|nr:hypothetical protein [Balneolaceae bacterium]
MKKLKELFSDTLIYGISSVFARFIGYLLVPLHTGVFAENQYGIVTLVFAAIALFNVLFTMGMESTYIRYGKDRDKAEDIFKTLQLFLLGTSLLFVVLIWLLQPLIAPRIGLPSGDPILWMMLGILFFDTIAVVPFAELRIVRRPKTFAVLKTANVIVNLGLNFYLILGLDYGIEAVFISNLVASFLTAIATALFTLPLFKGSWDKDLLKKALYFGLPFIPAGFGHAINELVDRFFLKGMDPGTVASLYGAEYTPDDVVGIYGACYKLAVFMLLIVQMFRMAWQPFFMRESDEESAPVTFAQTFSAFNVAAAAVFLGVALFAEQIVSVKIPFLDFYLVGQEYWLGLKVVPLLLIAYWFQGWYINFSAGIFISENTQSLARITLFGAGITIICNIILVPLWGMMGAATATLISYSSMALLIFYYSTKAYAVPYNIWEGLGIIVCCATAVWLKPLLVNAILMPGILASVFLFVVTLGLVLALSFYSINKAK